jgi:hypothetical protein
MSNVLFTQLTATEEATLAGGDRRARGGRGGNGGNGGRGGDASGDINLGDRNTTDDIGNLAGNGGRGGNGGAGGAATV